MAITVQGPTGVFQPSYPDIIDKYGVVTNMFTSSFKEYFTSNGSGGATDLYWPFVSTLLHGDSPQQFNQDTSTNVFPITANGAVQASTRTPFTGGTSSYGSGYFAPSSGYLTTPNNAAFSFGTSDFTIECWVYLTNALSKTIFDARSADTQTAYGLFTDTNGKPYWYDASGTQLSSTALNTSTWTHIAVVRTSGVLKIFTAGAQTYSAANTNTQNPTGTFSIGKNFSGSAYFDGYISNFRVVNGTAVYTSAFTPPTAQLTAISGTALLTLQTNVPQNNNQFFDTSTNNFTVTRNGNTTQGSFNPFTPVYPYAVATNGGSAYFDGTGDYLQIADNATLTPAGDFTIEFWAYPTVTSGTFGYYGKGFGIQIYATGNSAATNWWVALSSNNTSSYFLSTNNTVATSVNAWAHIALYRSGNNYYLSVNGTAQLLATSASTPNTGTSVLQIGSLASTYFVKGYISNVRYVNGTAVYGASNFTPPTAPLTAVTNTALLLGMSNGAIYDNTMLNNLETVGNSQISTSTFKYGTGALKFGGTSTDYMPTRKTSAFVLGSSDFTIECWVNFASATANGYFAGDYDGTSSFNFYMWANAGVMISTLSSAGNRNCTSSAGAIVVNTWYHIAFVRDGNTNRQYINGVQNGTVSVTGLTADTNANPMVIGNVGSAPIAPYFNGYIDDFRFTKGICRYPSGTTFTPPTAAFPNQGLAPFAGGTLQTLVVAGGGGGGAPQGVFAAGGGAGGYLTTTGLGVPSGVSLPVVVGLGGAVGSASAGTNGGNSSFWSSLAYGGGGGGKSVSVAGPPYTSNADGSAGLSGGSGGGGGSQYYPYGIGYAAGAGTAGQGYAGAVGGVTSTGPNGSGGGGAGGSPVASTGTGGAGVVSSITGSSVTYAKGGVGDVGPNTTPAVNTGSGGGGYSTATAGASGIVVIRYADSYPAATATTGSPTITVAGGYRVYKFTATGSITF